MTDTKRGRKVTWKSFRKMTIDVSVEKALMKPMNDLFRLPLFGAAIRVNLILDLEGHVCSPATKRARLRSTYPDG